MDERSTQDEIEKSVDLREAIERRRKELFPPKENEPGNRAPIRRRTATDDEQTAIADMRKTGASIKKIAVAFGRTPDSITGILAKTRGRGRNAGKGDKGFQADPVGEEERIFIVEARRKGMKVQDIMRTFNRSWKAVNDALWTPKT